MAGSKTKKARNAKKSGTKGALHMIFNELADKWDALGRRLDGLVTLKSYGEDALSESLGMGLPQDDPYFQEVEKLLERINDAATALEKEMEDIERSLKDLDEERYEQMLEDELPSFAVRGE